MYPPCSTHFELLFMAISSHEQCGCRVDRHEKDRACGNVQDDTEEHTHSRSICNQAEHILFRGVFTDVVIFFNVPCCFEHCADLPVGESLQ